MTRTLAVGLGLVLAACQPSDAPAFDKMPPEPVADLCGGAALQSLLGQDKSMLAAMTLPVPNRVIPFGRPVTKDYSETRLNISIGKDGRIQRVYCG